MPVADGAQLDRIFRDSHLFDRPRDGTHATGDLGPLERGAGGRRGGDGPAVGSKGNLTVCPDVDEQAQLGFSRPRGRQQAGNDIAADVRPQGGESVEVATG